MVIAAQAQDASTNVIRVINHSADGTAVLLINAESKKGQPISLECFSTESSCSGPPTGEYLMSVAKTEDSLYTDCTNVALFKDTQGNKERVGIYCWLNPPDLDISSSETVRVENGPSTKSDKIPEVGERQARNASPQRKPTIDITRPTILAFFAPVIDVEISKDGDTNAALDDFQLYANKVRQPLKNRGIDLREVYAVSLSIRIGKALSTFKPKKVKVGYYFIAPGKKPRVQYGVITDADLLKVADEYFGSSGTR